MTPEEIRTRLRGVIAFPVTPFNSDFSLDLAGLRKNIQELLRHPIAAIVAAGGTGEVYSLTPSEHLAVVQTIVEEVRCKVPVIAGTGFNRQMAIELAQQSARAAQTESSLCRRIIPMPTKRDWPIIMQQSAPLLLWACSSTAATG